MQPTKDHVLRDAGSIAARTSGVGPELTDLAGRLERQDSEIESLCAELLERYEEATLVYRISERIGSVLGEQAIAGLVVREAATVLGAHAAELWVKVGADLVLAAALQEKATAGPDIAVQDTVATGRA